MGSWPSSFCWWRPWRRSSRRTDTAQDLNQSLAGPSLDHLLGTDQLGRDILSRAIYGAQTSMTIAIGAPLVGALIGIPIGIASGWFGGVADFFTQRAFEVFTMVPQVLMALLLIALFGSGVLKLLLSSA